MVSKLDWAVVESAAYMRNRNLYRGEEAKMSCLELGNRQDMPHFDLAFGP